VVASILVVACAPPAARAKLDPLGAACGAAKLFSGIAGKACGALRSPGKILSAGKKLATGHVGSAAKTLLGGGGSSVGTAVGLAALGAWVLGGARFALAETAKVLGQTTSPQLESTWFSAAYWRMAGIAALLTMPFLFAAVVQAVAHSDPALLARAALGYLPLALVAVGIAAPLTMLLLAASDQLSAVVSSAAGGDGTRFLAKAGGIVGVLAVFRGSPFLAFLVGLLAAAGALVLWLELLMREAAVYVVVLMLPLAFAAMVWPSRRVWAIRAIELLLALVMAKFAIVAVLSLGGAALGHRGGSGIAGALGGAVLVMMGAFAPWALLRLLPVTELASRAAGPLRGEARASLLAGEEAATAWATHATGWAGGVTSSMRRQAGEVEVWSPENGPLSPAALPAGDSAGDSAGEGAGEGAGAGSPPGGALDVHGANAAPAAPGAEAAPGEEATPGAEAGSGTEAAMAEPPAARSPRSGGPSQVLPEASVGAPAEAPAEAEPPAGDDPPWPPKLHDRPLILGLSAWPPPPVWEGDEATAGAEGAPDPNPHEDGPE
jgi:hypothetical protein